MLWTSLLDRLTDLPRRSKDDGNAIALHAGANGDRLAWRRTELARVGFEAQVEFPDLLASPIRRVDRVRVAAVWDRGDLPRARGLAQVDLLILHPHHPSALLRGRCLVFGYRLQISNDVLTRVRLGDARKGHARAGQETIGIRQPLVQRSLVPCDVDAFHRVRVAHESFAGSRFAIPDMGEAGPGHVLARRNRVARYALREHAPTALRVTRRGHKAD